MKKMGLFKRVNFQVDEAEASTSHNVSQPRTTATTKNNDNIEAVVDDDDTKKMRKKSLFNLLGKSSVTEATLQVFRQLPGEIRHDPSMINFQREAERWKAEHSDAGSISGRSLNATDMEMEETSKFSPPKTEDESEDEYDGMQFVSIKVTSTNGSVHEADMRDDDEKEQHESEEEVVVEKKTTSPKRVRMMESPSPVRFEEPSSHHQDHHEKHHPKIDSPFNEFGKTFFLVCIWVFIMAFLVSTPEKKIKKRQLVVPIEEAKIYDLPHIEGTVVHITIQAPFLPDPKEYTTRRNRTLDKRNKDNFLTIFLKTNIEDRILTPNKTLYVYKPEEIDFVNATKLEMTFDIGAETLEDFEENEFVQFVILSNFSKTPPRDKVEIPIMFSHDFRTINKPIGVLFASFTLILLYALIVWEVVHRTFAAIIASTLAIAFLASLNDRPTHEEIIGWIDVESILLLFSMMIVVGILTETGVFDHLAVYAYRITNGQIWPLIHCLCIITCAISMLLDNVTTVLLMAPITITLCEDLDLNPVPILMAIVVHANIGGCATPVGDPPNVIITTNPTIMEQGITFLTFSAHMLIGVVIITIATNIHLRLIYPNINTLFIQEPKDIKILKKNILTWERTLRNSISPFSKDADMIRETLVNKVKTLKSELKQKLTRGVVETTRYKSTLEEMEKAYPIKKKGLLIKSGIALTFILVLFFVQSIPEIRRLSLGWSALLGVIFLLIISDRDDMDAILHRVEWPTLLFFAAMFVLMEAVERMGFIAWIGSGTENIIKGVSRDWRLAVAIIIILWVSALTSAFVESLPVTQMMVKIVVSIAGNAKLGLPMQPLIWALAFGPALGGNGTLVGASANVICAGIAEQHGYKMNFMEFFKFGFPMMLQSITFSTFYLLLCHFIFSWH